MLFKSDVICKATNVDGENYRMIFNEEEESHDVCSRYHNR